MSFLKKIKRFFTSVYEKLVKINDSPGRIATGFGLGVFLGLFPGTGPIAALILASVFRVNKLAALAGAVLTNTWLSIVTATLAMKVGSFLTGTSLTETYNQSRAFFVNFKWKNLDDTSFYKIIFPFLIGYFVVSLFIGLISYLAALIVLKIRKPVFR